MRLAAATRWHPVHSGLAGQPIPLEIEKRYERCAPRPTPEHALDYGISKAHQAAGFDSPCAMKNAAVKEVMDGIRRVKGTAQVGKAAILTRDIRRIMAVLPVSLLGRRDAALLLVGFAGAFRRSELVGLTVADVEDTVDGLKVTLRRSKTDQDGKGRVIGVPWGSDPATCRYVAIVMK